MARTWIKGGGVTKTTATAVDKSDSNYAGLKANAEQSIGITPMQETEAKMPRSEEERKLSRYGNKG